MHMRLNFSQQDLKQIIGSRFENVKNIQFDSSIKTVGDTPRERKPIGVFDGCTLKFHDGESMALRGSDVISIMTDHLANEGFGVDSDSDIVFNMHTRVTRQLFERPQVTSVFNGIVVECQELNKDSSTMQQEDDFAAAVAAISVDEQQMTQQ